MTKNAKPQGILRHLHLHLVWETCGHLTEASRKSDPGAVLLKDLSSECEQQVYVSPHLSLCLLDSLFPLYHSLTPTIFLSLYLLIWDFINLLLYYNYINYGHFNRLTYIIISKSSYLFALGTCLSSSDGNHWHLYARFLFLCLCDPLDDLTD
jgi:hypothetical protein